MMLARAGVHTRLGYVGVLEDETLVRQGVHGRRLDALVAVAAQRVVALLIGGNEEEIGLGLLLSSAELPSTLNPSRHPNDIRLL